MKIESLKEEIKNVKEPRRTGYIIAIFQTLSNCLKHA